jgi:hypothetical protein
MPWFDDDFKFEKCKLTEDEMIDLYYEVQKTTNRFIKKKLKVEGIKSNPESPGLKVFWSDGFENRPGALQLSCELFIAAIWATAGRVCYDLYARKHIVSLLSSLEEFLLKNPRCSWTKNVEFPQTANSTEKEAEDWEKECRSNNSVQS